MRTEPLRYPPAGITRRFPQLAVALMLVAVSAWPYATTTATNISISAPPRVAIGAAFSLIDAGAMCTIILPTPAAGVFATVSEQISFFYSSREFVSIHVAGGVRFLSSSRALQGLFFSPEVSLGWCSRLQYWADPFWPLVGVSAGIGYHIPSSPVTTQCMLGWGGRWYGPALSNISTGLTLTVRVTYMLEPVADEQNSRRSRLY